MSPRGQLLRARELHLADRAWGSMRIVHALSALIAQPGTCISQLDAVLQTMANAAHRR